MCVRRSVGKLFHFRIYALFVNCDSRQQQQQQKIAKQKPKQTKKREKEIIIKKNTPFKNKLYIEYVREYSTKVTSKHQQKNYIRFETELNANTVIVYYTYETCVFGVKTKFFRVYF